MKTEVTKSCEISVPIFKRADEFDADYLNLKMGLIFQVQYYNNNRRLGVPTDRIFVTDLDCNFIGFCTLEEGKTMLHIYKEFLVDENTMA